MQPQASRAQQQREASPRHAPMAASTGMRYSRTELEALSGAPSREAQKRRWGDVYAALAAAGFSGEYDGLLSAGGPPNKRENKGKASSGAGRGFAGGGWREAAPQFLELGAWRNGEPRVYPEHYSVEAVHDPSAVHQVVGESFDHGESFEYKYDEDSDDDDHGILKPAFVVDGDPDFDSGEPLDGFEYLRRVRWEANQIPRVKVAKIDLSTARHEQTPYMPEIPDIPTYSTDLCASKDWEDTFINNFLETRLAFSELDNSVGSSLSTGMKNTRSHSSSELQTEPTLTMIQKMDSVSRAATLRNYIDMIQSFDTLSRKDCLWLFALCIAVDTPFDAETSASMRSLLRKCATILATKSEMDHEVVMLNILIAISGRYFGQYESR